MKRWPLKLALLVLFANSAQAQSSPALLQNASYWSDGRSEVDFYDADLVRNGQHFRSDIVVILTPIFVDPVTLGPAQRNKDGGQSAPPKPAMRFKQGATVERGLLREQHSLELLWGMDPFALLRLSFTGTDGIGNFARIVRPKTVADTTTWSLTDDTYFGLNEHPPVTSPAGTIVFYDELPVRVRTIDFSKDKGEFNVQLAGPIGEAKIEKFGFAAAKISFQKSERQIDIDLKHARGTDHFVVDANFPFLLREWKMAGGDSWKMKNSLRADPEKYAKPGDRERALKDPMLRHPD